MVKFIAGIIALFGGLFTLLLPYFKKENEKLNVKNKGRNKKIKNKR